MLAHLSPTRPHQNSGVPVHTQFTGTHVGAQSIVAFVVPEEPVPPADGGKHLIV